MAVVESGSRQSPPAPEHEEVHVRRGRRSGLLVAVAVHRTVDGRSLGGCRMWRYASDDDAVRDVRRLARAMTFKAATAGLRLGGGKGVIALPAGADLDGRRRRAALRDFAELVDSLEGRYVTAQDVGVSAEDTAYIARFTDHVTGRPPEQGGAGDPSPYTARGVEVAIRTSLGGPLAGRHVAVAGLGHVGGELARRLTRAGARLTVSDIDPAKRALAEELGAGWTDPADIPEIDADVFAPCALGGLLDHAVVRRLRARVVAGAANNQLADEEVADALRDRGILWAPDFIANAGGLIAVADELRGFERARVEHRVDGIGRTLADVYARAAAAGTSTLIAAYELAAERLSD
jgi:leucine dehydrogenase